jgi:hypothetical protein
LPKRRIRHPSSAFIHVATTKSEGKKAQVFGLLAFVEENKNAR